MTFRTQIDVLNRVQQLNPFRKWPLEGFPARDQSDPTSPFVDHRRNDGFLKIVRAGRASAVDQPRPPQQKQFVTW